MTDPAFLRDAENRGLAIEPSSGEDVQMIIESLIATPKDVIATLKHSIETARAEAKAPK
jgi:hypothetical protein